MTPPADASWPRKESCLSTQPAGQPACSVKPVSAEAGSPSPGSPSRGFATYSPARYREISTRQRPPATVAVGTPEGLSAHGNSRRPTQRPRMARPPRPLQAALPMDLPPLRPDHPTHRPTPRPPARVPSRPRHHRRRRASARTQTQQPSPQPRPLQPGPQQQAIDSRTHRRDHRALRTTTTAGTRVLQPSNDGRGDGS